MYLSNKDATKPKRVMPYLAESARVALCYLQKLQ